MKTNGQDGTPGTVRPDAGDAGAHSSLARSFVDLTENDLSEAENHALIQALGWRSKTGWDELLESRLILLLSEAQSGKTFECQACQKRLWDEGQPAFYLELALVDRENWRNLFSHAEFARFEAWQRTESETAAFFLDSIDELRLTQGTFRSALRKVANALAGQLGRTRIILTSRPLPVDRQLFVETFAIPAKGPPSDEEAFAATALGEAKASEDKKGPREVRTVALAPLTPAGIEAIARAQGVRNIDAFFAGLRASSMLEFMTRPQDVIGAAAAWKELNGRFGTHAEQVQFDIAARLTPNPKRDERPLAPSTALDGAKRLALAMALSQRLTILHDDRDADAGSEAAALDPAPFLVGWDRDDVRALLERGLFGFASYGRVRFHNRLAVEYLAAARLSEILQAGASQRSIRRLLVVRTAQGHEVIRPSLRDVAAWLACLQPWVFDLVRKLEPAVLLNLGDPGSLTVAQRRAALVAYIDQYGKGGWRGLHVPRIQVHRIADPALGPTVLAAYAGVENVEVRQFLLELIEQARLHDCAPLARGTLWQDGLFDDERIDALDALVALDDIELVAVAYALVAPSGPWTDRFVRHAVIEMFPGHLSIDQLVAILTWIPETRSIGRELSRTLPILAERLDADGLRTLLARLTPLVADGLCFDRNLHAATATRLHLVPLLAALAQALLAREPTALDTAYPLVLVTQLGHSLRHDDEVPTNLKREIQAAGPTIRPAIFDAEVAMLRFLEPENAPFEPYADLLYRGTLDLGLGDDGWLRARLSDPARDLDTRAAALLVAVLGLSRLTKDRSATLARLKVLVADQPDFVAYVERYEQPVAHSREMRRMALCQKRREQKAARRKLRARASWIGFWRELADDPEPAFAPDRLYGTAWGLWRVMERTGERSAGSSWNRALIEAHFGKAMADRLRAVMMPIWRGETPRTSSEQNEEEGRRFFIRWNFALCAIAAEAEDPHWASGLNAQDAETATRYALLNMNGFPPWLDALATAHPAILERIIGDELATELGRPARDQVWAMTLQSISHAAPALAALFLPRLRTWLDDTQGLPREGDGEDAMATRLAHVIEVLLKFGNEADRDRLRGLAEAALRTGVNEPYTRVWLPTLFNLDPAAAVARLEAMCADILVARDSRAVAWIAHLFGHRHRGPAANLKARGMTGDLLLRLVRLAYHHVDRQVDAVHEGSYEPDLRDDAETGRGVLLNAILDLGGEEGWAVKLTLASSPDFGHLRDRLHALAMERSARDAEGPAMMPAAILAFDRQGEPGPRTAAEMFALMSDRLDDLEDYLLRDDSPLDLWHGITAEKTLRREVSRFLAERTRGAYSVHQEGVTADEKETDIRLLSSAAAIEGVFELKVGDKPGYSGASLKKTVRDQLVVKYLAPENRRVGFLLISRATRQTWKDPEGAGSLNFEGLIAMLRAEALAVAAAFPGELHIAWDRFKATPYDRALHQNS